MPVRLFMDHNVLRPITSGLRLRGVDVLTAFEDGSHELDDPDVLDRAGELGRVLYTEDDDSWPKEPLGSVRGASSQASSMRTRACKSVSASTISS